MHRCLKIHLPKCDTPVTFNVPARLLLKGIFNLKNGVLSKIHVYPTQHTLFQDNPLCTIDVKILSSKNIIRKIKEYIYTIYTSRCTFCMSLILFKLNVFVDEIITIKDKFLKITCKRCKEISNLRKDEFYRFLSFLHEMKSSNIKKSETLLKVNKYTMAVPTLDHFFTPYLLILFENCLLDVKDIISLTESLFNLKKLSYQHQIFLYVYFSIFCNRKNHTYHGFYFLSRALFTINDGINAAFGLRVLKSLFSSSDKRFKANWLGMISRAIYILYKKYHYNPIYQNIIKQYSITDYPNLSKDPNFVISNLIKNKIIHVNSRPDNKNMSYFDKSSVSIWSEIISTRSQITDFDQNMPHHPDSIDCRFLKNKINSKDFIYLQQNALEDPNSIIINDMQKSRNPYLHLIRKHCEYSNKINLVSNALIRISVVKNQHFSTISHDTKKIYNYIKNDNITSSGNVCLCIHAISDLELQSIEYQEADVLNKYSKPIFRQLKSGHNHHVFYLKKSSILVGFRIRINHYILYMESNDLQISIVKGFEFSRKFRSIFWPGYFQKMKSYQETNNNVRCSDKMTSKRSSLFSDASIENIEYTLCGCDKIILKIAYYFNEDQKQEIKIQYICK